MKESDIRNRIKSRFAIEKLNPMQEKAIGYTGDSLVLIAPTGSGKTMAYVSSLLRTSDTSGRGVQALIIAPSRELVMQIYEVVRSIGAGYKVTALYGGHSMREEQSSLSVAPDIVVATPGRLTDHIERSGLDLSGVGTLVIDEYDKCLDLGFSEEMRRIVKRLRGLKRVILTSATELSELPTYLPMENADTIVAGGVESPKSRTRIMLVESPAKDKAETLSLLLRSLKDGKAIVFVNHRESAERVHGILKRSGLPAGLYHGGMEQQERELALALFENGTTPILVSTDLASRGLDITGVDYVVHYHLPVTAETWIHRNGRTARMGAHGEVHVIVSEGEDLPDYVEWDNKYAPGGTRVDPITSKADSLYLNLGKKDKISRGDIVGYLIANGGLSADEVGKISLSDHSSLVAVPSGRGCQVIESLGGARIKNKRVRVTRILR